MYKRLLHKIITNFIVWYPTTVPTGIAVLRYNLAVAYAIRGELDKSGETLKQVIKELMPYMCVYFLQIYK